MPHHIRELLLDSVAEDFEIYPVGPNRRLPSLSKINLFVGPNNSGKSRFLRELSKIQKPHFVPQTGLEELREWRETLVSEIKRILSGHIADIEGLKVAAEGLPTFESVTAGTEPFAALTPFLKNLAKVRGSHVSFAPGKDDSAAKDERHLKLADKLKERFVRLERREIENLLLPATIMAVVEIYEKTKDHFGAITYEAYATAPLGKFIEDCLLKSGKKRKGSYQTDSGTIEDKNSFCEKALEQLKSLDDLAGLCCSSF